VGERRIQTAAILCSIQTSDGRECLENLEHLRQDNGKPVLPIRLCEHALNSILNDQGRKAASEMASHILNRGQPVLVFEPLFDGTIPQIRVNWVCRTSNSRGVVKWVKSVGSRSRVQLADKRNSKPGSRTGGGGNRTICVQKRANDKGMRRLSHWLDAPVSSRADPELFCLHLYKYFDVDRLVVTTTGFADDSSAGREIK
jgi:hypothetical protein